MKDIRIYAFSDEASPEIDKQIAALKRNGLDGMEIRGVDGTNVSNITLEKAKEVREKMDAAGLCVRSIGSPIGKIYITDDFAAHLDSFKHTLEIAGVLGSQNIRIFSFFIPKGQSPLLYKNEVIDRMGQFVELAKEYDITLCHENEKDIYGDVPERCLDIHRLFPSVKAIFDPANFVQCGVDTLKAWEKLQEHVCYLHVKDALADGYVVPAGSGIGNVEKIVKEYLARGGRHFTVEPHLKVFSGFESLEKEGVSLHTHLSFPDNDTAFDAACTAFKNILQEEYK